MNFLCVGLSVSLYFEHNLVKMVTKDRYLVVVSVLEGRKFPKRSKHKVFVEARFDGEVLATDPVPHIETPEFTNEVAWELDKKGLHQHKMQRTSIKVQVYAQEFSSSVREAVGYVVLDLRSAQTKQAAKWYPLLHSKYNKSKPEIKLAIYIDEDKGNVSFKAKETPNRTIELSTNIDPKFLKPELNEVDGYYQIGPVESCNEHFVLSVTVSFAENLPQLIPTNKALPASGYFFYYSVLGNDVRNDAFYDLLNPNFPAERASVRIRSSVEALRAFFISQPGIEVHLCCGDQSLGNCEIPLKDLIKKGSTEIYMHPVKVEGAFALLPPKRIQEQTGDISSNLSPHVGASVVLRKEEVGQAPSKEELKNALNNKSYQGRSRSQSPKLAHNSQSPSSSNKVKTNAVRERSSNPHVASPPSPHDGSYTETFESDSKDEKQPQLKHSEGPRKEKPQPAFVTHTQQNYHGEVMTSSTEEHIAVPASPHHYCVSLDFRYIKNLDVKHHANIFLRYTYPFFGSSAPIITQPPVEVRKGMEVLIPQSFCTFDFATTAQQLQDTFFRIPLLIEVWDKDVNKSESQLIGAVQLQLSNAIRVEKIAAVHPSGMSGWRQIWSNDLPIISAAQNEKIGELNAVISLEDWGSINTQQVAVVEGDIASQASTLPPTVHHNLANPEEPRETLEYKAAMELEMWKEQQEAIFKSQMKQKEIQHMKTLAEEWKKRDKEREVVAKRKEQEYQQLSDKLQKRITDLEKREKQLSANEHEVLRLKKDLEREHERKMTEMREASRRMKEDFEHQVQMEKAKAKEQDEYILRLKTQIAEEETKRKEAEHEFAKYKEQQNSKPEVRLQSEINLLTLEKVELERKLDAVTKSKIHYKQQWGKALRELANMKQKEQIVAKAQLKKQQQELEHMRLRYLAAEEKEVVNSERRELEEIKNELNHLREHSQQDSVKSFQPLCPDTETLDATEEDHISRLIEERDSLLRTGVYTTEDRIIAELDRQIKESIAKKQSVQM